jgi:hypothetical protein
MLIVEALASLFGVDHYNPPVKLGKPFCVKGFEANRDDAQAIAVLGSVSVWSPDYRSSGRYLRGTGVPPVGSHGQDGRATSN